MLCCCNRFVFLCVIQISCFFHMHWSLYLQGVVTICPLWHRVCLVSSVCMITKTFLAWCFSRWDILSFGSNVQFAYKTLIMCQTFFSLCSFKVFSNETLMVSSNSSKMIFNTMSSGLLSSNWPILSIFHCVGGCNSGVARDFSVMVNYGKWAVIRNITIYKLLSRLEYLGGLSVFYLFIYL